MNRLFIRVIQAYTKLKLLINYSMRSMLLKASFFISFTQDKSLSNRGRKLLRESLLQVEFDEVWSTFFLCENVFQS